MKKIQWFGVGRREVPEYGLVWEHSGAVVPVEDDEVAEDILTQPGENFVDVTEVKEQPVAESALDSSELVAEVTEPPRTSKARKKTN